jgi:shikimate kinase
MLSTHLSRYGDAMAQVLITGMSGAGKSTLLDGLARRGYLAVDTDYDGWMLDNVLWDEPRVTALLDTTPTVVVSGTVRNQATFYPLFDHVVLLSAPFDTLLNRVSTRTTNPYGKRPEEAAEIAHYLRTVEPFLRQGATPELDGRDDRESLVNTVATLLDGGPREGSATR